MFAAVTHAELLMHPLSCRIDMFSLLRHATSFIMMAAVWECYKNFSLPFRLCNIVKSVPGVRGVPNDTGYIPLHFAISTIQNLPLNDWVHFTHVLHMGVDPDLNKAAKAG